MKDTVKPIIIEVKINGPLVCHGRIIVKGEDGVEVERELVTSFCRCGASANKPYCDGMHRKIEFKS